MCRMHGTITHSSVCSSTHASTRAPPGKATAPASHPGAGWRAGEGFEQGFFWGDRCSSGASRQRVASSKGCVG